MNFLIIGNLKSAMKAMIIAYSTSSNGNLNSINFKYQSSSPFIEVDEFSLHPFHHNIWEK